MKRMLCVVMATSFFCGTAAFGEEPALKQEIPAAAMPDVKVTVSPKTPAVGDEIVWAVTVRPKSEKAEAVRVVLPDALDFGELEIVRRSPLEIGLVAFAAGDYPIPAQKLTVVDERGNIAEVMSKPFDVKVKSLIANAPEPQLKEDKGPGEVVMEDDFTLLYIAITLGGILLVVLLTLLIRRLWALRKPRPAAPPPPPRPAEDIAREKLQALRLSSYLEEGMHKTYHLKLSEAVREYLGNRYGFDSLERSTTELVEEIKARPLPRALFDELVRLLEDTDLVKFAKFEPTVGESRALLDEAFRIVDVTTQEALQRAAAAVPTSPVLPEDAP